jgi:hypothetical protein
LVSDSALEREPARDLVRPLTSEVTSPNEPVKALPIPLVWEPASDRELESNFVRPLVSDPVREIEPNRDLKNENFWTALTDSLKEPVSVLKNEFFSVRVETKPSAVERAFPIPLA